MEPSIRYPDVTERLLGVFKGGGAKGIVYCAALHELRARGLWFDAVAGSSAGAITAALIAAGYPPDELTHLAGEGLLTVRKNWFGSLRSSGDRSLFRTAGLEDWLERTLVARMPNRDGHQPLTFAELHRWSGIELNVVAMDIATAQPIVFNHVTSPDFGVSAAVVASSAIPIAMRPRRVAVTADGRSSVHRLVDGGAWANYPRFVFADPSFRAYHRLGPTEPERILGFVIESTVYSNRDTSGQVVWPAQPPIQVDGAATVITELSPAISPFDHGTARRMGLLGALLTWTGLRVLLGVVLPIAALVAIPTFWTRYRESPQVTELMEPFRTLWTLVSFGGLAMVIILCVVSVVVSLRLAPEGLDCGMPSIRAALSVGPGVPAWVGFDPAVDKAVRLSAPLDISTTDFKASSSQQALALDVAGAQAAKQLDRLFPDSGRDDEIVGAHHLIDAPEAPQPAAVRYKALLTKAEDKRRPTSDTTTSTILLSFYGAIALFMPYVSVRRDVYIGMLVAAVIITLWVVRLVKGRQRNQSMLVAEPVRQPWILRLVFGVALAWLGTAMLRYSETPQVDPDDLFMKGIYGFILLAGVACVLSSSARIFANHRRRQFFAELAKVGQPGFSISAAGTPI